jgi:Tfp pilus assembly protein PilN
MDMIRINLLPREFRRKTGGLQLGKTGYYAVVVTVGVICMIALITIYQIYQIKELDNKAAVARYRTQQLQKDIAVVDALIDVKGKIMQRMEAVDRLDRHRTVWVRILEDVTRRVPEFAWLSQLNEVDKKPAKKADSAVTPDAGDRLTRPVEIRGYSFTLSSLANFMIKLMRSNFFSDIEMIRVEEEEFQEQRAYRYELSATLHYLSDEELKKILEKQSGPDLLASF